MSNPIEIIEELVIYKFGLRMNYFSKDILIEYADEIINTEDNPDFLYIEISTSSKNEIIDKLNSYTSTNNELIDTSKLIGIIYNLFKNEQLNLEGTVMLLYKINSEFDFGEINHSEIHRLDDQYHLVSNRYVSKTIKELRIEFIDFFTKQNLKPINLVILKK